MRSIGENKKDSKYKKIKQLNTSPNLVLEKIENW